MNKYFGVLLAEAGMVFMLVFAVLYFTLKPTEEGHIRKRRGLYSSFSVKTIIYIFIAAGATAYLVSEFSYSGFTTALVFVAILGLAPLLLNNEKKRIQQEDLFAEIVLYCQNMGMLLKQTHNVYSSLQSVSKDLSTSLKEDVEGLLSSLEEGKDAAIKEMATLEGNYPYSCIRNLDVIILHMFFETVNVDDSLLVTYQDDVTRLERDVRANKAKRKSLRYSYIIITAGSVLAYWFFVRNLSETFASSFDNSFYRVINTIYVFATMLSFFFVDRYFNLNTTKE